MLSREDVFELAVGGKENALQNARDCLLGSWYNLLNKIMPKAEAEMFLEMLRPPEVPANDRHMEALMVALRMIAIGHVGVNPYLMGTLAFFSWAPLPPLWEVLKTVAQGCCCALPQWWKERNAEWCENLGKMNDGESTSPVMLLQRYFKMTGGQGQLPMIL